MPSKKTMLNKEPIKIQVADYIRNLILTGEFSPDDRIVPGRIAEELNVGRGVIREALIQLEAEGLIRNIPYRGSFVTSLSVEELEEICSIRTMLESYAVRKLEGHITEADFDSLRKICCEMKESSNNGYIGDLLKKDSAFHGYFVKKADQGVLYETWDSSSIKMATIFFSMIKGGYNMQSTVENHLQLIEKLHISVAVYTDELSKHYLKVPEYLRNLLAK
ncbi:MAG: GntR family transcriptional regulator [Christensenellales bacterium]